MRSTEIDRRRFLALLAAYGGTALAAPQAWGGLLPRPTAGTEAQEHGLDQQAGLYRGEGPLYLAARRSALGFEAVLIDGTGRDQRVIPMPDRGHSFAIDAPRGRAVAFGRQPGFFAIAFDMAGKQPLLTMQAAEGRHFFGHGVYSPDGKLMVATENNYEAGHGVLGLYDASGGGQYRRLSEFPTHGVGPHEVVLMPDGRTLCVANGGILTHPDYGKLQLNADTMQPSLAYIDMHTGDLLEQVMLPQKWHRLSIRHMIVDGTGSLWFGCQHTGPAHERPPLVGRHRRGEAPTMFSGNEEALRGMKNYVGSLACNAAGTVVATSSPVGGQLLFWEADSGRLLDSALVFDGCGVAPAKGQGFIVSSGHGLIASIAPDHGEETLRPGGAEIAWDNHLRRV